MWSLALERPLCIRIPVARIAALITAALAAAAARSAVVIGVPVVTYAALASEGAGPPTPVTFTHGVASGDVTPVSAALWTRADRQVLLLAELSTEPTFPRGQTLRRPAPAFAAADFTAKALFAPLRPDTVYYYRFVTPLGASASDTGRFRTAPLPHAPADVRFTYSGDSDGTHVQEAPSFNTFEVLDRAREEEADFFIYLGDTIYADSPFGAPAVTLDEYRAKYRENRTYDALRGLLAATSAYAIWDDHEVLNDFDGQTVDPLRLAAGRQAFKEYMPLLSLPAELGFFRTFRWGRDAHIVILDERSFRSGSVEAACAGDLVPTLPASLRAALGLPAAPPPGCLEALADPRRTMLGALQKGLLKAILLHSDATFKFIVNEVPVSELFLIPYDRWEGYAAERAELLSFIGGHGISNVVFLTTDLHANVVADVSPSVLGGVPPVALEAIAGPIATHTLLQELVATLGPTRAAGAVALVTSLNPPRCFDFDAYGYGLVEVDSAAASASITLKDDAGGVLCAVSIP